MPSLNLKDIWTKAQDREEKLRRRGPPHESKEWWEQNLSQEFPLDFAFFSGKTVLEVGCGSHGMIHYIDTALAKVGIDPLCSRYRDYFANWDTKVHHVTGVGESLPFKNGVFDIVILYNVIDHGISPPTILKEVERVLKQNGHLVFSVATFSHRPKAFRSRLYLADKPHPHHLSRKETKYLLQDAGFTVDFYNYQGDMVSGIVLDIRERLFYCAAQRLFAILLGRGTGYYICSKARANEADIKLQHP